MLWAILFTAGPGFFLPLEQEVSRALSARRSRGEGSGPLAAPGRHARRRAAARCCSSSASCTGPFLVSHLFSDQVLLVVGLMLGLVGYYMGHLARGTVSGLGRFRPYAVYIGGEGIVRLLGCVVLAVVGVETAGRFGIVLGLAPIIATSSRSAGSTQS